MYSGYSYANIEKLTVYGHRDGLIGESISAPSGIIGQGEIQQRRNVRANSRYGGQFNQQDSRHIYGTDAIPLSVRKLITPSI